MLFLLPDELLLEITSFLSEKDYIALANVNARLLKVLTIAKREIKLGSCYDADLSLIHSFLNSTAAFNLIKSLDLSHCYWLDPEILTGIILPLSTSLNSLFVHGTTLDSVHLTRIVTKCQFLTELSASFSSSDVIFWNECEPKEVVQPSDCVFAAVSGNLTRLIALELHGDVNAYNMITVFLSFCPNIESLSLIELGQPGSQPDETTTAADRAADRGLNLRRAERWSEEYLPLLPTFRSLRRLYCRSHAVGDLMAHSFLYYLVGRILSPPEAIQLDVLWFPHVCVDDFHRALGPQPKALHVTYESVEQLDYPADSVLSLCVDSWYNAVEHAAFMEGLAGAGKLSGLKLASLCYGDEHFLNFARSHRELRVLQLQTSCPPGPFLTEELGCFSKLVKFSVDPDFFRAAGFYGDEEADILEAAVRQLVTGCPRLEEIEIGIYPTARCDNPVTRARSSCLSLFSGCARLKRLTLANLKLDKLDFLSLILCKCPQLSCLRLTNLKNETLVPAMVKQLNAGLTSARCLEDFRWELGQSGRGKFVLHKPNSEPACPSIIDKDIFTALQKAPALRRLAVITDSKVALHLEDAGVLHFHPRLILAVLISPHFDTPERYASFQICSGHPAFRSYLGANKAQAAFILPAVHYNQMVLFESQVTSVPLLQ